MSFESLFTPTSSMDGYLAHGWAPEYGEGSPASLISTASPPGMEHSDNHSNQEDSNNIQEHDNGVQEDDNSGLDFGPGRLMCIIPGTPAPGEQLQNVNWKGLDLSSIEPQGSHVRILMLPMTEGVSISPYGGQASCYNWVQVGMMDPGSMPAKLLAVVPTSDQVGCCITYGDARYIMYFDPSDDRLIFRNKYRDQVDIAQLYGGNMITVEGKGSATLKPSEWVIMSASSGFLVEFKLLRRKTWNITASFSAKRSVEEPTVLPKKARLSAKLSVIRAATLEGASSNNPLLTLERGEVINVGAGNDSYQLTREAPIADHQCSSVWQGKHSEIPGKAVVTKVIKAGSRQKDATVQSAEVWLREVSIHSSIGHHYAIVPYLGCDARFHCIYTEHVDAEALIYHVKPGTNEFNGNGVRTWRVLGDIASALSFLHGNNIVHGDVRLDNILFNPVRGATLIDFNLSFKEGHPLKGVGAPWYLPPEYLQDHNLRGVASDMWGLGVVMLWLLGHVPMPEGETGWRIADLHPDGPIQEVHMEAQKAMEKWLNVIRGARLDLKRREEEIAIVVETLVEEEQDHRPEAKSLVQQLAKCNLLWE
ncbi:hypothetical protein E0Z10_g8917 [Xylaria hypoxylon]|uniref:EKC/KEOPS complex subunit BUD32 n=1 Tax=Xylaria hypoxylon TaxID=37992 RepID=A0A4Z0YTT5_9PEZI|nr:hypothetical protein E0Z10_g8917 [Xylaria hypoxylon]